MLHAPAPPLFVPERALVNGEEPYSIAWRSSTPVWRPPGFRIDAVDFSARVLAFAEHATYGRIPFAAGI